MELKNKFFIGVDGGGTGTRIIIQNENGEFITGHEGQPSALSLGIDNAWKAIIETISIAFAKSKITIPMLSECAIGLGLSGVNNIYWKNEFLLKNPGFKNIAVDTDGYTTLLGAHGGKPGSIVALGTGSIGMILTENNSRKYVSGWGYPSGDEASGAWIGLHAVRLAEKVLDQRKAPTELTTRILKTCGNSTDELLSWLSRANQNNFAKLAPIVFDCAKSEVNDLDAIELLKNAGLEVEKMVLALDPNLQYPFSICGRLGEALIPFLTNQIKRINRQPESDSTHGALLLIKRNVQ
jgi:glucosamine kinase